ncbi:MAG: hypothetical protein LBE33_06100 [Zoogloeaceae bacterium]|jgi:hypothetical protein|nr:hypothetical protein [Zoogloeaceae bacterium]
MTGSEFDTYLAQSVEELETKQATLSATYGIGNYEKFFVDFMAGTLTFLDGDTPKIKALVIPVATHVPSRQNLLWAWANEQLPPAVREQSSRIKELQSITGFELFANERVECDESMAWELTALACKYLSAAGAYRIPNGEIYAYVLITSAHQLA